MLWRLQKVAMLLLFLLVIPGCSDGAKPLEWQVTLTDLTAEKCPPFADADKAEGRQRTPRPADWKTKGASVRGLQARIDTLETDVERKNGTIQRMDREHEACIGPKKTS